MDSTHQLGHGLDRLLLLRHVDAERRCTQTQERNTIEDCGTQTQLVRQPSTQSQAHRNLSGIRESTNSTKRTQVLAQVRVDLAVVARVAVHVAGA